MVDSYTKLEEGRRCKISSSYSGQWMVCNLLIYLFMGFSICYFLGVTEPPERETAGKWGLLNADVTKCLAPVWLTSITLFFFLWWELLRSTLLATSNTQHNIIQFSSVAQSCLTLCDPMNCNTPGLPVHHQLPEFTQTHVHQVSDAIQPSHPLSSPSPPAPNPSQHQGLFQWVNSSHEVAKVLEFQL